jgi:pyruvate dehydrogenase E2 component (dihydrolipoamide acetyltransferase)
MKSASPLLVLALCACVTPQAAQKAPAQPDMEQIRGAWIRTRAMGAGDNTPVVFIHGYGSRLEAWREVQPVIAEDRPTLSLDQRGFGFSDRTEGEYGPAAHAADVIALMDAHHFEKAIIVGHSYGSGVALRVAMMAPERVAAVVLVSPFAIDAQLTTTMHWARVPVLGEMLFGAFFEEIPGEKYLLAFHDRKRFVSVEAIDETKARMSSDGAVYAALETVRGMDYASVENQYAQIAAPIVMVWGTQDRVTKLRDAPKLRQKIPQARLITVPDVGHMPPWESPAEVIRAIREVDAATAGRTTSAVAP